MSISNLRLGWCSHRLPRVIPDLALQQLAVGEDDLLSGFTAHARRLQADVLDLAAIVLDRDLIADDEGFIHDDRDRGKQIAQDVLNGERDRESADTNAGEKRPDLDVER